MVYIYLESVRLKSTRHYNPNWREIDPHEGELWPFLRGPFMPKFQINWMDLAENWNTRQEVDLELAFNVSVAGGNQTGSKYNF